MLHVKRLVPEVLACAFVNETFYWRFCLAVCFFGCINVVVACRKQLFFLVWGRRLIFLRMALWMLYLVCLGYFSLVLLLPTHRPVQYLRSTLPAWSSSGFGRTYSHRTLSTPARALVFSFSASVWVRTYAFPLILLSGPFVLWWSAILTFAVVFASSSTSAVAIAIYVAIVSIVFTNPQFANAFSSVIRYQ